VFVGWGSAFSQVPKVAGQKVRNAILGSRPVVPWWPLNAIDAVERVVRKDMKAIEFGSGSSTIWLAQRVKSIVACEHNKTWVDVTNKRIANLGISNAEVRHKEGHDYFQIDDNERFDFAVVDGEYRWKCLEALSDKMIPGGYIYFDNSDSDKDEKHYQEFNLKGKRLAQAIALELCSSNDHISAEHFHGMINGELFAGSGMLISF
jgi:precorrin-6B methylase 2